MLRRQIAQRTNVHQTHQTSLSLLDYHCVVCDASSISQTSVKAKDHPRAKKCTAAYLWCLATINKAINDSPPPKWPILCRVGR